MTMPVIYIAGKYRAPDGWLTELNVRVAEMVAFDVARIGAMPLCPHTNTRFFDGTLTAQFWLDGTLELMRRCDAVLLCWNWKDSAGAIGEKEEAERLGIPVFTDLEALHTWIENQKNPAN